MERPSNLERCVCKRI